MSAAWGLPVSADLEPMLALLVEEIPVGDSWAYEPKWDGFRCLAFRDGDRVEMRSKSGQPLARYFPELVAALRALPPRRLVLDGEIVVPVAAGGAGVSPAQPRSGVSPAQPQSLSFDDLLQRIHPAESRVRKLSEEFPALYVAFDLLVDEHGRSLLERTFAERRAALERFASAFFEPGGTFRLSPATDDPRRARGWLRAAGGAVDGVVAKRTDFAYRSGDRTGMQKIKFLRTADCVVGGFRYAAKPNAAGARVVGSLLLGLYDEDGALHHVGFCSGLTAAQRKELTPQLEALVRPPGFTGRAPGGPSRWSTERSGDWQPLDPKRVVEVQYDHFSQGRFRHGTRFLRWRPDKSPRQCTLSQADSEALVSPLTLISPTADR